jgi:hypothetical protein
MSNVKVYVEGEPQAVAEFFKMLYSFHDESPAIEEIPITEETSSTEEAPMEKPHRGRRRKKVAEEALDITENVAPEDKEGIKQDVTPEVVKEDLTTEPTIKQNLIVEEQDSEPITTVASVDEEFVDVSVEGTVVEEVEEHEEKPVTLPMVVEALKEYARYLQMRGGYENRARSFLEAIMFKNAGVKATKDIPEDKLDAVFRDCVDRVNPETLEEYL